MQGAAETLGPRPDDRRVYRLRFRWLCVLRGPLCALAAAYNLAFGLANDNLFNVLFGLVLLPNVIFAFLLGWVLRIEASSEGLTYYNMGFYTVHAGWDDVVRVARVAFTGMGRVECVILRRSTVRGWTGPAWALPKAERGLTVPLGKAWSSWSHGDDLKREILRHAPHAAG